VSADKGVIPAPPGDGPPTLLTVGSNGQVSTVRPAERDEEGWQQSSVPGFRAWPLAAARDASGALVLAGASSERPEQLVWVREEETGWSEVTPAYENPGPIRGVDLTLWEGQLWVAIAQGETAPYDLEVGTLLSGEHSDDYGVNISLSDGHMAFGRNDQGQLGLYLFQQPQLYAVPDSKFETRVYNDHHSGAHMDVSFWRAATSPGQHRLGDSAQPGYGDASGVVAVVEVADDPADPLLAEPTGASLVWTSHHSGSHAHGSLWHLDPPEGYVALGDVAQDGYDQPNTSPFRAVRADLAAPATTYVKGNRVTKHGKEYPEDYNQNLIWANWGKHGGERCSVDRITPTGEGSLTGCFSAHNNWQEPDNEVHCLATDLTTPSVVLFLELGSVSNTPVRVTAPGPGALSRFAEATPDEGGTQVVGLFGSALYERSGNGWTALGGPGFRDAALAASADGNLVLFAVGTDHALYYARRTGASWAPWAEIVTGTSFVTVSAALDSSGEPIAFAVDSGNSLHLVDQDPDSTDWRHAEVEQEAGTAVRELEAWAASLSFSDASGPLIGKSLELWSDRPVMAEIGGRAAFLDPGTRLAGTTGDGGVLMVQVETGTLDAPVLSARIEGMAKDAEPLTVELNAEVQQRLRTLDGPALLSAPNSPLSGTSWDNPDSANAVAEAVRETMALGAALPSGTPSSDTFPGTRQTAQLTQPRWQISFADGVPRLSHLDEEEMARVKERHTSMAMAGRSWSHFGGSWGDIWDEIEDGAAELWEITVDTIEDGAHKVISAIEATIEFVIDGANYIYTHTVALVDQVFDVVAGIFKKIGAGFEELFNWLGNLFSWPDILLTQKVIQSALTTTLDYLPKAVDQERQELDATIATLSANFQKWLSELDSSKPDILTQSTGSLTSSEGKKVGAAGGAAQVHNPMLVGLVHHVAGATDPSPRPPTATSSPLSELQQKLEAVGNQLLNLPGLEQAVDDLKTYTNEPGSAVEAPLDSLFTIVKDLAALIVQASEVGLTAFLDALFGAIEWAIEQVSQLLTKGWEIPLLAPIYNYLVGGSGDTVSFVQILSLAAAIPATAIYKVLSGGEAPYPDDASVQAFEKGFTVDWLLSRTAAVTDSAPTPALAADTSSPAWMETADKVLAAAFSGGFFIRGLLETVPFGFLTAGKPVPLPLAGAVVGLRLFTGAAGTPYLSDNVTNTTAARWMLGMSLGPVASGTLVLGGVPWLSSVNLTLAGLVRSGLSIKVFLDSSDGSNAAADLELAESLIGATTTQTLHFLVWPNVLDVPQVKVIYGALLLVLGGLNGAGSEAVAVLHAARAYGT
jgi:hypothetical protein